MSYAISSTLQTAGIILLVILFFNVMIFVHELGHFLAGKWRGAYIDRFQIWFGKPLWSKKIRGVQYGIGWIPAGGFVSLPQLEDMQAIEGKADVPKNLKPLKPWDKIIIAAAGPLFSLLLAYAFAIAVWIIGMPTSDLNSTTIGYVAEGSPAAAAGLLPGDKITAIDGRPVHQWAGDMEGVRELVALSEHDRIRLDIERTSSDGAVQSLVVQSGFELPPTKWWQRQAMRRIGIMPAFEVRVGSVMPGSPADQAGLRQGDRIVSLNGEKVFSPAAVLQAAQKGDPLSLGIVRSDGGETVLEATPRLPDNWKGKNGSAPILGINWADSDIAARIEHPTPQSQINKSLKWMGDTLAKIAAPGSSIGMEHLSGPVGIGNYLYKMMETEKGWLLVLWFAVVLNVNLAVLNILPLPIVDGGHVVLGFIELIRKKPVSGKILDWVQGLFFFVLIAFFLFVTFKDVGDAVGGGEETEKLPEPQFNQGLGQ